MSRVSGIVLGAVLVLAAIAGCGEDDDRDPAEAALPAVAPRTGAVPAGVVMDLDRSPVTALAAGPAGSVLVAVDGPPRLLLVDPAEATAAGARTARSTPLPGPAETVSVGPSGVLVSMPGVNTLMRLTPDLEPAGQVSPVAARAAVEANGHLVVAATADAAGLRATGLDRDWDRGGFEDAARLAVRTDGVWVLDRAESSLTELAPDDGDRGRQLRAGRGVSDLVVDRYDRLVVTDTRAGELLVFGRDPLLLLQRHPVPGVPYGIAYDRDRNIAWVTLTARNELVGYELTGGEPVERYRFATIQQPNFVTTVASDGSVVVGSAAGAGLQVIDVGR